MRRSPLALTNKEVSRQVERAGLLPDSFLGGLGGEVIHAEPRLLPVLLHVDRVPVVIVQSVGRFVFNDLSSVSNVVAELNSVPI